MILCTVSIIPVLATVDRLTVTLVSRTYGDGKLRLSDTTELSPSSMKPVVGTERVASTVTDKNKRQF